MWEGVRVSRMSLMSRSRLRWHRSANGAAEFGCVSDQRRVPGISHDFTIQNVQRILPALRQIQKCTPKFKRMVCGEHLIQVIRRCLFRFGGCQFFQLPERLQADFAKAWKLGWRERGSTLMCRGGLAPQWRASDQWWLLDDQASGKRKKKL